MQQSSSSVGALAAALAKAQIELVNPERSMIATIRSDDKGGAEQIFRYAPLSSGLEILRKTLGQHEIAILQATAIDQAAGVVKLTTTLCHSSGEWVGSTWPVCSIGEVASPKRMGASLTYARRYALFALVGIAGEDDLDAPDLNAPEPARAMVERPMSTSGSQLNGGRSQAARKSSVGYTQTEDLNAAHRALKEQLSAVLRDQLMGQLEEINSAEDAAIWAHRILPAKNRLNAADARKVEAAFEARLTKLHGETTPLEVPTSTPSFAHQNLSDLTRPTLPPTKLADQERIENGNLVPAQSRRVRDKEHLRFVATQPCVICGRTPADAHHLRFAQRNALGRKVSDEFTVPLCRGHHGEVHRYGNEAEWWKRTTIEPTVTARILWLKTHPLPSARSGD